MHCQDSSPVLAVLSYLLPTLVSLLRDRHIEVGLLKVEIDHPIVSVRSVAVSHDQTMAGYYQKGLICRG